ncbi:MAG: hypothetical protein OQK77_09150 [Psychromonas sp.]|nr:hypothetical protein [Psychromonas sp.]
MEETPIQLQLEQLFKFEQQLHRLLEDEQYEQFQQQQVVFSAQIKTLLDSSPADRLNTAIDELNLLKKNIARLKNRSENAFKQLRQKSLLHRRNKNRINAYK